MDFCEIENVLSELKCTNEKIDIIVNDLNNTYFGYACPEKSFLKYYYNNARIKSAIAADYIRGIDASIQRLSQIIGEIVQDKNNSLPIESRGDVL